MVTQTTAANPGSGTVEQGIGVMTRHYQRRAWQRARREWCAKRSVADDRGEIDWHRFAPIAASLPPT